MDSIRRLEGRVALVTGAAQGIGRAIAFRLAAEGAKVAVTDSQAETAAATAADIVAKGGQAAAHRLDVREPAIVREAVAAIAVAMGPIDILVNNAGWDRMEPFLESTPETWDTVIAINYRGVLNCCAAVAPGMKERGRGKIVSIASDAGRAGATGEAVYSGCKGAVIAFSKALARELARYSINVNVVCPGPTDTALLRNAAEGHDKLLQALVRGIPMRRLGQPDDISGAVAFFASADADFITGQVLSVSGGLTMMG